MVEYSEHDAKLAFQWADGYCVLITPERAKHILVSEIRRYRSIIHEAKTMATIMRAELEVLRAPGI
jgi:hypothetical protein